jgi:hypothetical protein
VPYFIKEITGCQKCYDKPSDVLRFLNSISWRTFAFAVTLDSERSVEEASQGGALKREITVWVTMKPWNSRQKWFLGICKCMRISRCCTISTINLLSENNNWVYSVVFGNYFDVLVGSENIILSSSPVKVISKGDLIFRRYSSLGCTILIKTSLSISESGYSKLTIPSDLR